MSYFSQDAADRWREEMVALGFGDDGVHLRGSVVWRGTDGAGATARVELTPSPLFPFAAPRVRIVDAGTALEPTFHIERDGALCLWEDDWPVDQAPWRHPRTLVARIAGWLDQTAAGWPGDDSCDLERYLPQDAATFIVYDASRMIFDTPVRTIEGPAPGTVIFTPEQRRIRDLGGGRRRRKDNRLAWVSDVGAITRPIKDWTDVAALLGDRAREVARLITFGALSWVLLRYSHGGALGALALRVRRISSGIEVLACESADASQATRALRAGALAAQLANVRIAVVGCGAIGSFAADMLFRSGVRHLTLLDGERLRPGNLVRHLCGDEHVGRLKTDAVRHALASVDRHVGDVRTRGPLHDLAEAIALVENHHVVLEATGSARASSLMATAADLANRGTTHTVVSVCLQREGQVLRVDRMPLRDGESYLPALPLAETGSGLREQGCGSPVSPTAPAAVIAAAELALRVVLDEATCEWTLPATVADVRSPQSEPPFHRTGPLTSGGSDEPQPESPE